MINIKFGLRKALEFSFRFSFLSITFSNSFLITRTPKEVTAGWTSRCKDGRHVLFMDYDGQTYDEVVDELNYLQSFYQLGNFYIFESGEKSFHAVCLDKFPLFSVTEILKTSNCDYAFINSPKFYRAKRWVLRTEKKGARDAPVYASIVPSQYNNKNIKSTAHRIFMNKNFKTRLPKQPLEDGYEDTIGMCFYRTGNRVK